MVPKNTKQTNRADAQVCRQMGSVLRDVYAETTDEPLPEQMQKLLEKLEEERKRDADTSQSEEAE